MGLDVCALRIIKPSNEEDGYYILRNDFEQGNQLEKFEEGYYEAEKGLFSFCCSYGFFRFFRALLCNMVNKCDVEILWKNPEKYFGTPFLEMINYSDCEGDFDYVVAEKLYNDFCEYEENAKIELGDMFSYYLDYKNVLKECVDIKGVVHYY